MSIFKGFGITLFFTQKASRLNYSQNDNKPHSIDHLGESREYWWNDDFLELLSERLGWNDCKTVADIGCGNGIMSINVAKHLPEGAIIKGLDFEKRHLKSARQKVRKSKKTDGVDFEFTQGNAHDLPYGDEEMDLTFCQTLLIHVPEPLEVIQEMKRITKKDHWVVALEPNNLVPNLMFDNLDQLNFDVKDMLEVIEVRLRCEKGKQRLGEGYSSLGDVLPDLFLKAGLKDIKVWISDKALTIIPPYDTREKRVRASQLVEWFETDSGGSGYEDNLRYFKAGGGKKSKFDSYWLKLTAYKEFALQQLKEERFVSAGGNIMYVVAGKV